MNLFSDAANGRARLKSLSARPAGFTLVELLVVIGIIALLISILLPSLASARRSANSVKCLASLKEIGNAFSMYAMENKGYFPAARDKMYQFTSTGRPAERRWTDLLAKYFNKQGANFQSNEEMTKIRLSSVLWGCPEWSKTYDFNAAAASGSADQVYNGYGMQYFPSFPEQNYQDSTNAFRSSATRKGYFKQVYWARRGAERLLVADSAQDIIALPSAVALADVKTYKNYPGFNNQKVGFMPYITAAATGDDFVIDSRHMKPGTQKRVAINTKTINALFCDGHAQSVTPREAFNAIRNPGQDSTR
jgi:prepilin-type N-terminal cleavage/methylation domain-containing protein/prepilin-type processing-associated H-X9-DG protein